MLDVGCGNGLLQPFLTACGAPPAAYLGIDLSSRMVQVAEATHGESGATFEAVSFDAVAAEAGEPPAGRRFDAIVFNGSLQFFADQTAALAKAAGLLAPGPSSRIVLSHLSGAAFVRKEAEENPNTVRSVMPELTQLEASAAGLGLQVVIPSFYGTEVESISEGLEDFYLVMLRWDAAHGGSDGMEA